MHFINIFFRTNPFNYYILLSFFTLFSNCQQVINQVNHSKESTEYINYNIALPKLIDSLHIQCHQILLFIDKSEYTLSLMIDSTIIKEYPVVFGDNPTDDKLMEGDQCTPEGVFKIRAKYPHASWSKFIWIDYPNENSWKNHNKAKQENKIPQTATIGGEIGIHGVPNGLDNLIDLRSNWTLGCISLKNSDVNEIYKCISTQNLVKIVK